MKLCNEMLQNAFLKIVVNGAHQRLYLKDVKTYKKLYRRRTPPVPTFSNEAKHKKNGMESE